MKIAIALLLGAASSHAALNKEEVLALTSKMKNKTPSMNDKVNALREAAAYLKRKEAVPEELRAQFSRRADHSSYSYSFDDDGDDTSWRCTDACDAIDWSTSDSLMNFCSSQCWSSCPSW